MLQYALAFVHVCRHVNLFVTSSRSNGPRGIQGAETFDYLIGYFILTALKDGCAAITNNQACQAASKS